jgi:hypothetical protein
MQGAYFIDQKLIFDIYSYGACPQSSTAVYLPAIIFGSWNIIGRYPLNRLAAVLGEIGKLPIPAMLFKLLLIAPTG